MNYKKGNIVLVKFPFTDLSNYKLRPALIISNDEFNKHENVLLIGIYGNIGIKSYSISIKQSDLKKGKLKKESYFRFQNIFSLHKSLIEREVAILEKKSFQKIKDKLCNFLD